MTRQEAMKLLRESAEIAERIADRAKGRRIVRDAAKKDAEAYNMAVYDMGIVEQLRKERDSAVAELNQIVRCKDCVFFEGEDPCWIVDYWNGPYDYCSSGRRKDEQADKQG